VKESAKESANSFLPSDRHQHFQQCNLVQRQEEFSSGAPVPTTQRFMIRVYPHLPPHPHHELCHHTDDVTCIQALTPTTPTMNSATTLMTSLASRRLSTLAPSTPTRRSPITGLLHIPSVDLERAKGFSIGRMDTNTVVKVIFGAPYLNRKAEALRDLTGIWSHKMEPNHFASLGLQTDQFGHAVGRPSVVGHDLW
jgi:hypothetical protein